ncbi:hypothetical protein HanRHA438_Chr05g0245091 [Helianthus annuus]|nr:hypothetical protein HanRHA438_Chr05g0245091 [Helianthus annuus]
MLLKSGSYCETRVCHFYSLAPMAHVTLQACATQVCTRHIPSEPIQTRHTVASYWFTFIRHTRHADQDNTWSSAMYSCATHHAKSSATCHAPCTLVLPAMPCHPPWLTATWSLQPLKIIKTTRSVASVQSASSKCHIVPITHAT